MEDGSESALARGRAPTDLDELGGLPRRPLLTVGHGTLGTDELAGLLHGAGIGSLVDIRTAPGSRRLPHMGRAEMARWVPEAGIDYRWESELGGFRKTRETSPNPALRNKSFRGYADYMQTDRFWAALDPLIASLSEDQVAAMCSETAWWRCHRRLVADAAILARTTPVFHLLHDGRLVAHPVTEGARLTEEGLVRYDAGQEPMVR